MRVVRSRCLFLLALASAAPAVAQPGGPPSSAPGAAPAPAKTVDYLEIIKVVEDVQVKTPSSDWQPAAVGVQLKEGTEISTGPDAEVQLLFPDQSVMVIKELTQILVSTLLKQGSALKAQVMLKIGEVSAQVNPKKVLSTDFSVRTPVATASVRGTKINRVAFSPARGMETDLLEGRLMVISNLGRQLMQNTTSTRVQGDARLISSVQVTREDHNANVQPNNLTENEVQQIQSTNAPQIIVPAVGNTFIQQPATPATLILRFTLK